jgi:peptide/nickel transport system permease protein
VTAVAEPVIGRDVPRVRPARTGDRLWRAWRRLGRNSLSRVGALMIAGLIVVSVAAPLLATHDPRSVNLLDQLRPPSAGHLFGTDSAGMDIFSRVLYGGRLALGSGLIILVLSTLTGSLLGSLAGYFGGRIDETIMRITDVFLAFPGLILAMAVVAGVRQRSLVVLVVAIALRWWAPYARIMRAQTMAVSALEFAQAAHASGASRRRVLFRHILPNTVSPIVVQATLDLGYVILTAASLSFIGFGVPPGEPEWGRMIADGREHMRTAWWVITFPGLAVLLTVLGFNLLGDGIRDVLDPRARAT